MTPAARHWLRVRRYQRSLKRDMDRNRTPHALEQLRRLREAVGARG